jgi:hypothetical protein
MTQGVELVEGGIFISQSSESDHTEYAHVHIRDAAKQPMVSVTIRA